VLDETLKGGLAMKRKLTERVQFTENRIAHLPVPSKRQILYDLKERNLGLKLEPTGSRTFFWFHSVRGKPKWRTIGTHPATTLENARVDARKFTRWKDEWKGAGYRGRDPFAPPQPTQAIPTLNDVVEAYCERRIPKKCLDPEFAAHTVKITVRRCFDDWRNKTLDAITHDDVVARHAELGKKRGHVSANRSIALLQRLYSWATGLGAMYKGENPAKLDKEEKYEESPRTRFLTPEEIVRLEEALKKESPDFRDFVALCLFSGQRKMEVLTARWDLIDMERARWTVPKPRRKNKRAHVVLLSSDALRILRDRKRRMKDDDSIWVFPGDTDAGHRGDFYRQWNRVRGNAGLDSEDPELHVTKHSLRHTNISYLLMAGRSIPEAAAVSGHRAHDMIERYGHLLDETVRETVAAGEAKRHELMKKARKQLPASVSTGQ
jgi:integrase